MDIVQRLADGDLGVEAELDALPSWLAAFFTAPVMVDTSACRPEDPSAYMQSLAAVESKVHMT